MTSHKKRKLELVSDAKSLKPPHNYPLRWSCMGNESDPELSSKSSLHAMIQAQPAIANIYVASVPAGTRLQHNNTKNTTHTQQKPSRNGLDDDDKHNIEGRFGIKQEPEEIETILNSKLEHHERVVKRQNVEDGDSSESENPIAYFWKDSSPWLPKPLIPRYTELTNSTMRCLIDVDGSLVKSEDTVHLPSILNIVS